MPKSKPVSVRRKGVLSRKGVAALGALNQGGSPGGGPININIVAADAKSFEDMCRRNPDAILGPLQESLKRGGAARDWIRGAI